jgi:sorting nexin-1/2
VENLFIQYKKLHNATETMYSWRKDLASSTKDFSKHIAILANSEEQLALSRALSQLSEIYEKIDQIYLEQSNSDYFVLSELVKDYVSLFDNIREVFYQRIKTYNNWQKTEEALRAKREAKAKLEASNKQDKIPTVAAEIRDVTFKINIINLLLIAIIFVFYFSWRLKLRRERKTSNKYPRLSRRRSNDLI